MSATARGGSLHNLFASDKIQGIGEVALGGALGTGFLWQPMLDQLLNGLHLYAAVGSALIVTHGLWRIVRSRRR